VLLGLVVKGVDGLGEVNHYIEGVIVAKVVVGPEVVVAVALFPGIGLMRVHVDRCSDKQGKYDEHGGNECSDECFHGVLL